MAVDVSTLESIYRMITPADLLGAQKLSQGSIETTNFTKELLDALYNVGPGGVLTVDALGNRLEELASNASPEKLEQFKRTISFYSSTGKRVNALGQSQNVAVGNDGKTVINNVSFREIIGQDVDPKKPMCILLSNSGYLSPATRNAERIEMFMNYVPSLIASRMVPILEVEFVFNRVDPVNLQSPGLMKFLLGSDPSAGADNKSADAAMIAAREVHDVAFGQQHTLAGMEMFTSPQTLINPQQVSHSARYVDVLDPFRPLMSIESFNVSVTPTVGMYSYKKATLTLKLHDRSRMAEISDLVRPQIYQNAQTAPTVWITYGWRHPPEPSGAQVAGSGNYSDFINGNMLTREAYGIVNSQFSFDPVGQVTLNIELWTKGIPEMRTARTSDKNDGTLNTIKKLRELGQQISEYRTALGIGPTEGVNREIRGFMLIESAERGALPDMSGKDIQDSIKAMKESFARPGGKIDKDAAQGLLNALETYYKTDNKQNLDFKAQLRSDASRVASGLLTSVTKEPDPFLPIAAKDKVAATDAKAAPHPFSNLVEVVNAYRSETDRQEFGKKLVSLGKLMSVFIGNSFQQIGGIDEMQLFFYQVNDHAGAAAGTNLAEFPIDMPVFLDQYREYVERKGSERLSIEEFFRLIIDAQVSDTRAPGYGFRSYFAPYDPANKVDQKFKEGAEQAYESALAGINIAQGPFKMPQVEMYIETLWASSGNNSDLLRRLETSQQFEQFTLNPAPNEDIAGNYRKIMRIHVFDKTNNPYKLPGQILRGDAESGPEFIDAETLGITKDYLKQRSSDKAQAVDVWKELLPSLSPDGRIDRTQSSQTETGVPGRIISNPDIKEYVSRMVPTIVYGMNGTVVTSANLASKQDPLLSVVQMQTVSRKSGKPSVAMPNGSGVGGLPLRVIPAALTINALGCPLLNNGQMFFIDFNTGTTIDNIYILTGLTHSITPGKFESQMTLSFYDAYGRFEGAPTVVEYIKQQLKSVQEIDTQSKK